MSRRPLLTLAAVTSVWLAACAQTPDATLAQFDPAANPAGAVPTQLTGSRISRTVSPDDRYPATSSNLKIITREDILRAGYSDLDSYLNRPMMGGRP